MPIGVTGSQSRDRGPDSVVGGWCDPQYQTPVPAPGTWTKIVGGCTSRDCPFQCPSSSLDITESLIDHEETSKTGTSLQAKILNTSHERMMDGFFKLKLQLMSPRSYIRQLSLPPAEVNWINRGINIHRRYMNAPSPE